MSVDETVLYWEGVPIADLSRDDLEAAFRQLMNDQQYWMKQTVDSYDRLNSSNRISLLRQLDRLKR